MAAETGANRVTLPVVSQLCGGAASGAGVFLLFGLGWSLVAVGVALVAVGVLAERSDA